MNKLLSGAYEMSKKDRTSRLTNIVLFFIPVLSYILVCLQQQLPIQWMTVEVIVAGLLLNLLKKFEQDNTLPTNPTA